MDLNGAYLRLFIYFPLVLLLLYFILRILKNLNPSLGHQSRIHIVEKMMISPRIFLLVVKIGDEYLLLSASASGVTLLKELGSHWPGEHPEQGWKSYPGAGGLLQSMKEIFFGKRLKKMKNFEEEFEDFKRNLSVDEEMNSFGGKYFPGKEREK